jgi:uncharacterized protein
MILHTTNPSYLMGWKVSCLVAPLLVIFAVRASAAGPSFDCSKASQSDDLAICASSELSTLELKMTQDFTYVRDHIDADQAKKLARASLQDRRNCYSNSECLKTILSKEIEAFEKLGVTNGGPVLVQSAPNQSNGPSYEVTTNFIREKLQDSFIYYSNEKNQGSVVAIDRSGSITVQYNYRDLLNSAEYGELNFNIRDLASDDGITYRERDGSVWLTCANKKFCIDEVRISGKHRAEKIEAHFYTVDYVKVVSALSHLLELLGGSRVKKDPF